jgi:hypothetical protein
MAKRGSDANSRIFFDELPSIGVSRLRATGAIRLEDRHVVIPFGGHNKLIGVAHTVFKNGGSWSYFRCPKCGGRKKKLWIVDDAPRCLKCCWSMGVRYRSAYALGRSERLRERDRHVDRLQAMLEGDPLRLKPVPPNWGDRRLDRRYRLTWAFQRARIVTRLAQIAYQHESSKPDEHCRSCAPTNHTQSQSRQSRTSNCSGGPDRQKNSNKPSTMPKASYSKHWKARTFERD